MPLVSSRSPTVFDPMGCKANWLQDSIVTDGWARLACRHCLRIGTEVMVVLIFVRPKSCNTGAAPMGVTSSCCPPEVATVRASQHGYGFHCDREGDEVGCNNHAFSLMPTMTHGKAPHPEPGTEPSVQAHPATYFLHASEAPRLTRKLTSLH